MQVRDEKRSISSIKYCDRFPNRGGEISITSSFWEHIVQISVRKCLYIIDPAWGRGIGWIRSSRLCSRGQSHRPLRWQPRHRANSLPLSNLESQRGTRQVGTKHWPNYFSCTRLESLPKFFTLVSYHFQIRGSWSGRNRACQLFSKWQSNYGLKFKF